jgi:hypothetical protein
MAMQSKYGQKGTINASARLGLVEADELSAKVVLAIKLNELIDKRGLSQTEVQVSLA